MQEAGHKDEEPQQTTPPIASPTTEDSALSKKDVTMVTEAKPVVPRTPLPKLAPGISSLAALSTLTGPESSNLLILCNEDGIAAESLAQAVQEQLVLADGVPPALAKDVDTSLPSGDAPLNEDEKAPHSELKCECGSTVADKNAAWFGTVSHVLLPSCHMLLPLCHVLLPLCHVLLPLSCALTFMSRALAIMALTFMSRALTFMSCALTFMSCALVVFITYVHVWVPSPSRGHGCSLRGGPGGGVISFRRL